MKSHIYYSCRALVQLAMYSSNALIGASALIGFLPGSALAQYYNPYKQQCNQWNNQFPGYQGGSREYRRDIREMNPYRQEYRQEDRRNKQYFGY